MSNKLLRPLLCLTLLVLSGCASGLTKTTVTSSDYCRIAKPIPYSSKLDSPATVARIEAHNSAWVCVCEHDCPKAPI
jgi:uncharacterized protein YceK